MPRPKNPAPTLRRHKSRDAAVCDFYDRDGRRRTVTLGRWGSPEAQAEYARLVATMALGQPVEPAAPSALTLNELFVRFLDHAARHYRRADGSPTDELANYKQAIRVARQTHGHVLVTEFGPLALKAVRQAMIDKGWSRKNINLQVGRIRRVFKFGVENELVPAGVFQALGAIGGLQAGRSAAKESPPVRPVADELVDRTLPHLNRQVAGLVRFMRLTGCRPGEACAVRRADIDLSGEVWVYRPPVHKLTYQGRGREIHIGPQGQALLAEFPTATPDEYVFSPRRELTERTATRAADRTTVYYASRQGWQRRKAAPKRAPGARYTTCSFGYAIRRACKKHGLEAWHPNQIRHLVGTLVRRADGVEAAQSCLGHAHLSTTQVYAERNNQLAAQVAATRG